MMGNDEIVLNVIKQQMEVFLLDAGEFFPFGVKIDNSNNIIPLGAYLEDENDRPPSWDLINLLESYIDKDLRDGNCIIAAIAIDITIRKNGEAFDGVEVRFFEGEKTYARHFKYIIQESDVEFLDHT